MRIAVGAVVALFSLLPNATHAEIISATIAKGADIYESSVFSLMQGAFLGNGLAGELQSMKVWTKMTSAVGTPTISVNVVCYLNSAFTQYCGEVTSGVANSVLSSVNPSGVESTVTFPAGFFFDPAKYYRYRINRVNGSGLHAFGTSTPDTCEDDAAIGKCNGTPYLIINTADKTIDPVIIIPGILGSEKNSDGVWVIDPILHTYDDLIATLDVNHYTPGVDLFTFPYDWRKSNVETAVLLKQKIDEVKAICNCDKVDLVAHSMGGLVARQYIQSDAYEDDVDQLIFLGTPHLGAPKAYLMWEGGVVGLDWQDAPYNFILSQEAKEEGYSDVLTYVRAKPISSVQQLLPVYDYIFDESGLRDYPSNYPINSFLQELNAAISKFTSSGVRVHNFVGNTSVLGTITGINSIDTNETPPKWEHGEPDKDNPFVIGTGDGTVATPSASLINENLIVKDSSHRILPTAAAGEIFEILTGDTPSILVNNPDTINFKLILIKILSPADLLVIDPAGKKVGKENGQAVNEIPNAFYTGFNTNTEYITILNPLDGEYKVITEGTGTGSYTVETAYVSEQQTVEATFTGNTTYGLITELEVPVDNENPEELDIQPTDIEPPVITITQPEAKDYLRSEQLPVNITAQDISGVFSLETKLGTTTIQNITTIDLFFKKLGSYTITASSTDNVGNATTSTRLFRVIATIDSTFSDIERAYSLGWMTKAVRDTIVKKFTAAIKISKFIEAKTASNPKGERIQKTVDKLLAAALIFELNKLRGKGLHEQAYQLLREDILWLINN